MRMDKINPDQRLEVTSLGRSQLTSEPGQVGSLIMAAIEEGFSTLERLAGSGKEFGPRSEQARGDMQERREYIRGYITDARRRGWIKVG